LLAQPSYADADCVSKAEQEITSMSLIIDKEELGTNGCLIFLRGEVDQHTFDTLDQMLEDILEDGIELVVLNIKERTEPSCSPAPTPTLNAFWIRWASLISSATSTTRKPQPAVPNSKSAPRFRPFYLSLLSPY
jgi:hypothetical protein